MNCQQVTSFIVEAARGQMLDTTARDGALRHAESCQACAARLAQEQSLTNALRALALDMKNLSAPARVEAKLLAAFRANLAQPDAPAATDAAPHAPAAPQTMVDITTYAARRRTSRIAFAATAIAASLVLVVLAALYLRFTQTAPPSSGDVALNNQPTAAKPVVETAVRPAAESVSETISNAASPERELTLATPPLAPSIEPERQATRLTADTNQRLVRGVESKLATVKLARRRTPTMIEAQHVIDGGNAIIEPGEGTAVAGGASKPNETESAKANETESVTDFISLVAGAPTGMPLESGQLVRVQMPRAALASLGLPLNAERGNEPVKADVLLGGDGLARAIRFVR